MGIISALVDRHDYVICDRENHASIYAGCQMSYGKMLRYRHSDMEELEKCLQRVPEKNGALSVTDGVFSMGGDIAKLPEICALAKKYGARVMVDDAHGLGVLGQGGRGTASYFGLEDQVDIYMGTFSKSLASLGGYMAASEEVADFVRHASRPFIFSASIPPANCATALAALRHLPRGQVPPLPPIRRFDPRPQPRVLSEEMDVNQGKLGLGYRCATEDTPAMILANLIFGGTSNSKLFMNVRERLSLCYYASSSYARSKGIMTVSSGVEQKDYDRAVEEITRQLTAVQNGDWEDWEQQGALQAMLSSLTSLPDSQSALENYYLGQIATDCDETPEQLARALREVTKERIMAAAQSARLDTVYFLHGKEEA